MASVAIPQPFLTSQTVEEIAMAKQPSAKKSAANTSAPERTRNVSTTPPGFRLLDAAEAETAMKRGRRGRRSKYSELVQAAQDLQPGQAINVESVAKNQVMSIRNVIHRSLDPEAYQVRSVAEAGGDTFEVFVVRKEA